MDEVNVGNVVIYVIASLAAVAGLASERPGDPMAGFDLTVILLLVFAAGIQFFLLSFILIFQIRKCCKGLAKLDTPPAEPGNFVPPSSSSRYNAVAVANRRIPQPSATNVSTTTDTTVVPTVLGTADVLENREWRMRPTGEISTIYTLQNENNRSNIIDRSLTALRMPYSETSINSTPISPPPSFSRVDPVPPMRMPKSHYSLPSQADNDGLPSYEEVQNIEKSRNENQR